MRKRGITTFLIGVVLIPYWSKLLNVKNQGETGGVGAFLDAGDLWRLDRVSTLRTAEKEMTRAHEVGPRQCKS
ncbi:MAG: hypothetical protein WBZ01_02915 [Terriglobales bacterium]